MFMSVTWQNGSWDNEVVNRVQLILCICNADSMYLNRAVTVVIYNIYVNLDKYHFCDTYFLSILSVKNGWIKRNTVQ